MCLQTPNRAVIVSAMELKSYLRGVPIDEREEFARRCGTTLNFLRLVAYRNKTPNAELCIGIARETRGAVPVTELRPDLDWAWAAAEQVAA